MDQTRTFSIGLLGYGKMGRTIEQIALSRGHRIAWRIDVDSRADFVPALIRQADVVIEFSRPEAAFENVTECLRAGVPVVSGTTGWLQQLPEAQALCRDLGGALIWASNFSVGVNLFFAINRYVSRLMHGRPEYEPTLTETHHIHKLDAPSGTAVSLANDLIAAFSRKTAWALAEAGADPAVLPITAIREGEVPGTHTVEWQSEVDTITLTHTAHSRSGFALGAVLAAEWLPGKRGIFTMPDVLGLTEPASVVDPDTLTAD